MKYYEEGELVDKSACANQRADLKKCLLESDCCLKAASSVTKNMTHILHHSFSIFIALVKEGEKVPGHVMLKLQWLLEPKLKKTPKQCLADPQGMVPEECFALRIAFFECKRSIIDTRVRFRGIKS